MTDPFPQSIHLSRDGEERRRAIGDSLLHRARARRIGRATLAVAACLCLLGSAGLLARAIVGSPVAPLTDQVAHNTPASTNSEPHEAPTRPPSAPAIATTTPEIRITVVSNEPIPDRPCAQAAPATASQVPICILNDQQLLSALSTTGESYGLVRVGGRTMAVPNTAH
jgi:hypothetical protein